MISAILASVLKSVEIIVVEDDSPDRTWKIASDLGNPSVKVIRRVRTRGLASAINRFASLVLGKGIQDHDSGFILMHRCVLDSVSLSPSGYGAFFIELTYDCFRKGLKVGEITYIFTERVKGISKSNSNLFQIGIAGMGYITRILRTRFAHLD
jgi:glycosyltransferase involved in cell wall biosynthesis